MNEWMNEWINERMNKRTNERMNERTNDERNELQTERMNDRTILEMWTGMVGFVYWYTDQSFADNQRTGYVIDPFTGF